MRVAVYKQIGVKTVTETVKVDDVVDGEVVSFHEETVTKEVPVMGMVYRDMTPEEEAQALQEQAEAERLEAMREPTVEEQLADLSEYMDVLTEMLMGGMLNGD